PPAERRQANCKRDLSHRGSSLVMMGDPFSPSGITGLPLGVPMTRRSMGSNSVHSLAGTAEAYVVGAVGVRRIGLGHHREDSGIRGAGEVAAAHQRAGNGAIVGRSEATTTRPPEKTLIATRKARRVRPICHARCSVGPVGDPLI